MLLVRKQISTKLLHILLINKLMWILFHEDATKTHFRLKWSVYHFECV